MIIRCINQTLDAQMVEGFIRVCIAEDKSVQLVHGTEHLDIDTPKKDSHALFEAGLDFAMLVTDKHLYLKAREEMTSHILPDDKQWVVQTADIYPSDVTITLSQEGILTDDGTFFSADEFKQLILWLENRYAALCS